MMCVHYVFGDKGCQMPRIREHGKGHSHYSDKKLLLRCFDRSEKREGIDCDLNLGRKNE
jgi:hypothetical protein